jgi:hypothetical protein
MAVATLATVPPVVEPAADALQVVPSEKKSPAQWVKTTEEALIEEWGEEFLRIGKNNLGARHWATIAKGVNERRGELPEYSTKQC